MMILHCEVYVTRLLLMSGEPVVVGVTMYVLSISSLSEVQMVPNYIYIYTRDIHKSYILHATSFLVLLNFFLFLLPLELSDQFYILIRLIYNYRFLLAISTR